MKKLLVMLMMIFLPLALMACATTSSDSEDDTTLAQSLYEARNPYIGDNSADSNLLALLNVSGNIGAYTIELQTENEPYGVTINFKNGTSDNKLMQAYACVLLALIDNAGEISWTDDADTIKKVDITTANSLLTQDVKSYGQSAETVQDLLDELEL